MNEEQLCGAMRGCGEGMQCVLGRSGANSYAIPTKDHNIQRLFLHSIRNYVNRFIAFAKRKPDLKFFVTAIGTGLAGYSHEDIAPFFEEAPETVRLPMEWREILARRKTAQASR